MTLIIPQVSVVSSYTKCVRWATILPPVADFIWLYVPKIMTVGSKQSYCNNKRLVPLL